MTEGVTCDVERRNVVLSSQSQPWPWSDGEAILILLPILIATPHHQGLGVTGTDPRSYSELLAPILRCNARSGPAKTTHPSATTAHAWGCRIVSQARSWATRRSVASLACAACPGVSILNFVIRTGVT
jgi:hypothetical protein